jgi:hypothetical protein
MKKMLCLIVIGLLALLFLFVYVRRPIIMGSLTKQTAYLWFLNLFHFKDSHRIPLFMLIDDDSGMGIFKIHEICERLGVKATFAVVPSFLDNLRCDSLRDWHRDGYGIAVHGYDHGQWHNWTSEEINADIKKSIAFFGEHDIAQSNQIRIVVTPYSYNTHAIRKAIDSLNLKMVVGANIVNPDTTTFPWYRLFITQKTQLDEIYHLLERVKFDKGFIIFGTHSSDPNEFSAEKTNAILRMAIEMGIAPYNY